MVCGGIPQGEKTRFSKTLAAVWDLVVQNLGFPQRSYSKLLPKESLKAP